MHSRLAVFGLLVALGACQNAGESRVLGITATGVVSGIAFFDRNGNRVPDAADTVLASVVVRLLARGTRDTVARVTAGATGSFRFSDIPVGSYSLLVDTASVTGDSIKVTRVDSTSLTLRPDDTVQVRVAASFPEYSIAQARLQPVGKKFFVLGVALNDRGSFGDSTMHLADTSRAVRLTAVRTAIVVAGDSVRFLGTRSTRNGQPTIDRGTVFPLANDAATPVQPVNTATAAAAQGGFLDAALIRVLNATISDTSTVQGNRRLIVNDNSGALEIRLDTIVGFRAPALLGDTVGAKLDIVGLLIPTGTGTWLVKPRGVFDVVHH